MINMIGFILLAIFKENMDSTLWWVLMWIDIILTTIGTVAIMITRMHEEFKKIDEEAKERAWVNHLVDPYLKK